MSYYQILGIEHGTSPQEIRNAYRMKALTSHPDKNPSNAKTAKQMFQAVIEAYETLSDPERRRKYGERLGTVPKPAQFSCRARGANPHSGFEDSKHEYEYFQTRERRELRERLRRTIQQLDEGKSQPMEEKILQIHRLVKLMEIDMKRTIKLNRQWAMLPGELKPQDQQQSEVLGRKLYFWKTEVRRLLEEHEEVWWNFQYDREEDDNPKGRFEGSTEDETLLKDRRDAREALLNDLQDFAANFDTDR